MTSCIIRVDHKAPYQFPSWARKIVNPELNQSGPATYSLDELRYWEHPNRFSSTKGWDLLQEVEARGLLEQCLGVKDVRAWLQYEPQSVITSRFVNRSLVLWKSMAIGRNGRQYVPHYRACALVWLDLAALFHSYDETPLYP